MQLLKKEYLIISTLIIILVGIFTISNGMYIIIKEKSKINEEIIDYYEKEENNEANNDYYAILEIPKLNLHKVLYNPENNQNNVNYNIEILKQSKFPFFIVLAGHSGTGKTAYFKDLIKLDIDDIITIYHKKRQYTYKIIEIWQENRDGDIDLSPISLRSLVLTTCTKKDQQLVILAVSEEKSEIVAKN